MSAAKRQAAYSAWKAQKQEGQLSGDRVCHVCVGVACFGFGPPLTGRTVWACGQHRTDVDPCPLVGPFEIGPDGMSEAGLEPFQKGGVVGFRVIATGEVLTSFGAQ